MGTVFVNFRWISLSATLPEGQLCVWERGWELAHKALLTLTKRSRRDVARFRNPEQESAGSSGSNAARGSSFQRECIRSVRSVFKNDSKGTETAGNRPKSALLGAFLA